MGEVVGIAQGVVVGAGIAPITTCRTLTKASPETGEFRHVRRAAVRRTTARRSPRRRQRRRRDCSWPTAERSGASAHDVRSPRARPARRYHLAAAPLHAGRPLHRFRCDRRVTSDPSPNDDRVQGLVRRNRISMGSFEPRPVGVQALSRRVRRWHLQGLSRASMASAKPCTRVRFPASPPTAEWVNYLLSGCFRLTASDRWSPSLTGKSAVPLNPRCGPGRSRWRGSRSAAPSTVRPTPTGSLARSRSTWTAETGSTRASRPFRFRSGPGAYLLRHCRCHRHRTRHTGATSSYTCCPTLGDRRLSRLNAEEIEQWLGAELARGISPSSVHRHYRTLRRVLQPRRERPPPRQPVRQGPTAQGAGPAGSSVGPERRLAEAHPEHLRPMIYLALDSGMRWSELVGLRRGAGRPRSPQGPRDRTAAADRQRVGPLPDEDRCGGALDHHLLSTAETLERHLAGKADGEDELVFTTTAGTPLQHSSFQTHAWKKALATAGVKCRFHDLRHASVALAIASGAHPKAIQVRMGHSTATSSRARRSDRRCLRPTLDRSSSRRRRCLTVILAGMTHRVGPKGQVVIPKELRDELGIEPGDEVSFWRHGDHVAVRPAGRVELRGRFRGSGLTELLEAERAADRAGSDDGRPRLVGRAAVPRRRRGGGARSATCSSGSGR